MIYTILSSSGLYKKSDMNSFIFFCSCCCCSYRQFSSVNPNSLVAILLVLEGSMRLVKSTKVYFLTLYSHLAIFDFDICHPCTWTTVAPVNNFVISLFRRFSNYSWRALQFHIIVIILDRLSKSILSFVIIVN
jgi:hypothetical protein